jgi:hypothetical protein
MNSSQRVDELEKALKLALLEAEYWRQRTILAEREAREKKKRTAICDKR